MIAYNRRSLDNRTIQEQAREALSRNCITQTEFDRICLVYPDSLYTPNFFIRIGLLLLTVLASLCCLGLFLLSGPGNDRSIGAGLVFIGVLAYAALELFIFVRRTYRAGIDDALLWIAGVLFITGINFCADRVSPFMESGMIFLLTLLCVARYAGRLLALVCFGAFLGLIFYSMGETVIGRALLPFVVMAVSAVAYLLFTRLSAVSRLRHYHSCLVLLRAAALLSFYAAGNYFVVREVNVLVSHHSGGVALGILWWTLTAIVPILYIVRGVQKKDVVFLWMGLALVAAAVFTLRYYYHILPAELAMIICGCVLIGGAWYLIRYLHQPKHGITSADTDEKPMLKDLPVEGLILAESFHPVTEQTVDQGFHYGGGTTGGGGAGGGY